MVQLQLASSTMSAGRNIPQDRQRTSALLRSVANGVIPEHTHPNWLGHRGTNAFIDAGLLSGTTMPEMLELRGGVNEHLRHLRVEHGLNVEEVDGVYRLAVLPL